ncbi:hypothetical protein BJ508DRAFT_414340 [Ascobolus immersus RN42]|uniref:Uncharacterized protein n=1 Tax=Ascobolus immersus RN42 TaxID=1160509 RepID=A0A3N4I7N2_ASCIM|nr:hypothetical protein BJ508DRAFT_414340 [Ascobolus immersus RN42]
MHISSLALVVLSLASSGICAIPKHKPSGGSQQANEEAQSIIGSANYTTVAEVLTSFPTCSQFCVGLFFDSKLDACGVKNSNLYEALQANKTSTVDSDPSKINWPCLCQAKQVDGTFDETKKKVESLDQALTCVNDEKGIQGNDSQCLGATEVAKIGLAYKRFTDFCKKEGHDTAEVNQDESMGNKMGAGGMLGGLAVLGGLFLML